MALLYLYPLVTKKWRVLVIAILTLFLIMILSDFAFGFDNLVSFLKNPTPDVPPFVYSEGANRSLLAIILRSSNHQSMNGKPILNPLFLGISLVLTVVTVIAVLAGKSKNNDWVPLSILLNCFLLFPAHFLFVFQPPFKKVMLGSAGLRLHFFMEGCFTAESAEKSKKGVLGTLSEMCG